MLTTVSSTDAYPKSDPYHHSSKRSTVQYYSTWQTLTIYSQSVWPTFHFFHCTQLKGVQILPKKKLHMFQLIAPLFPLQIQNSRGLQPNVIHVIRELDRLPIPGREHSCANIFFQPLQFSFHGLVLSTQLFDLLVNSLYSCSCRSFSALNGILEVQNMAFDIIYVPAQFQSEDWPQNCMR